MARKKHAEHVNHDRWLVSWADLLTLLFAFFVVMFASSSSDKKKAARMAAAMQTAFQQPGAFDAHAKTPPLAPGAGTSSGTPVPLEMPIESPRQKGGDGDAERKQIEASIAPAVQQHMVTIRTSDEGTTLSLASAGFFDSGSAEVKASAMPVLTKIAESLPSAPVRVEGHTDNQPIHTAQFRSNWELSTARASSIAEVLMRGSLISPSNFSLAGYGEFHPVAGNNTAEGRAANRRVDIVLIRAKIAPRVATELPHETEKPRSVSAREAPPLPMAMTSTSLRPAPSR